MNFKTLILSSIFFSTVSNSIAAPKENSIFYEIPGACTTLAMISAGVLSYKYQDSFKCDYISPIWKTSLITSAVGLLCAKYWIYNPKSYFESAKSKIKEHKSLINFFEDNVNIDMDFLVNLKVRYCEYDLPLAYAFLHVRSLIHDSRLVVEWLNVVFQSDKVETELKQEAEEMLLTFNSAYFEKLNLALIVIKEDPNFLSQIQILEQQEAINQMRESNYLQSYSNFMQSLSAIGGVTHYVKLVK